MSATRWLVTGAQGQLGRSLLAVAEERGVSAIGLARDALDITDVRKVETALEAHRPDVVVNAAAFTAVDRCETERELALRVNEAGAENVARACAGRALLMHVSTDYVFDGRSSDPLREDAPTAPLSAYGESKLCGEQAVAGVGAEHLIVRTSWLFGPGANFVRAIGGRAERGEDLRVVTDEAGRPTWTGTLARALLDVADSGARGTLHVANSGVTTRHEFACEIVRQVARRRGRAEVAVAPIVRADLDLPAERPAHAVLDIERAQSLGLSLPDWREALTAYLDAEEEGRDA